MAVDSLRYPLRGSDWLKTIAIGGVLGILSAFIVPAILVSGYLIREMRGVIGGETEPPKFGSWGDMFVEGVKAIVIGLIYAAVPFIMFLIAGGVFVLSAPFQTGQMLSPASVNALLNPLGTAFAGLLALIVAYLLPAALANFSVHGSVRSGFEYGNISRLVLSGDYLFAWLIALAIGFVLGAISAGLNLTIVGAVLVPFLTFYTSMVVYYLYGNAYRKVIGPGEDYYAKPAPEAPAKA